MSLFAKFKMETGPRKLEVVPLPIAYSTLTSANRYLVRQRYIKLQEGLCFYCSHELDGPPAPYIGEVKIHTPGMFPEGFFNHPIHLHHDNLTDMTIGAVHAQCNAVMWQEDGV